MIVEVILGILGGIVSLFQFILQLIGDILNEGLKWSLSFLICLPISLVAFPSAKRGYRNKDKKFYYVAFFIVIFTLATKVIVFDYFLGW